MVISRTPVRISFFGGGTDYPEFYLKHGGAVISTSIDKYSYITIKQLNRIFDYKYRISYSQLELCNQLDEIHHPSVRECLKFLNIIDGIEVHYASDLPARTGLGSSSSFTVGLLHSLYAIQKMSVSKMDLAKNAIYIERELIGEKVGSQDQCAAAFGGLNIIKFSPNGGIDIHPINITKHRLANLQSNLLLFYTGVSRYADEIIQEQVKKTQLDDNNPNLRRMLNLINEAAALLLSETDLNEFGKLLHETWILKRSLSEKITNPFFDSIYEKAISAGSLGGKLLGAGGGGFFLFYVEKNKQKSVRKALVDFVEVEFKFENTGTQVIYSNA